MRRIVPGKIEVKTKLVRNFTMNDLFIVVCSLTMAGLVAFTTLPLWARLAVGLIILSIAVLCVLEINTKKGYQMLSEGFAYIIRKKRTDPKNFYNSSNFEVGQSIKVNGKYTAVIELNGLDFAILEEEDQDMLLERFKSCIEDLKEASFIKYDKPVNYDNYVANLQKYANHIEKTYPEGKGRDSRIKILNIHEEHIANYNSCGKTKDCYFLCIKENDEKILMEQVTMVESILKEMGLEMQVLKNEELLEFTSNFFQQSDTNFTPELKEGYNSIKINDVEKQIISIGRYPFIVGNAWACELFAMEGVTTVFNFKKYGGKNLEKNLHNSIREINGNVMSERKNQSNQRRAMGQAEILDELINEIVFKGEETLDTQMYLMYDKSKHKEVIKLIRHCKMKVDLCLGIQKEAYLNMLPFGRIDSKTKRYNFVQMTGTTISGSFPFVSKKIEDEEGMYLGWNRNNIFFDVFKINDERVNANMVIIGQSGQGKSFAMKKILIEQASKDVKIFILDPEDEYRYVCSQLEGNYLDVAGAMKNKINPLQVFPSLKDESDSCENNIDDLSLHRIFLEQFLKTICPAIPQDCLLYLNKIVGELYHKFGMGFDTNFLTIPNDKFPIFNDLYKFIVAKEKAKNLDDFQKRILKTLAMYIEQFAEGGIYSNMWNGYTTLDLNNQFNVLNFRNLLSNNNRTVANAQMLLTMRYLNLEIIRNKTYNDLHCKDVDFVERRILVLVDEGHNFIDDKFTIALDFMKNMSKQIRKYGGAFWLATQNISDFVGQNETIKAKATAIIDNCKLSLIFSLQPNDLNNMIELYKSSRPFTTKEKELLKSGKRGQALLKLTNNLRVPVQIEAFEDERAFFEIAS